VILSLSIDQSGVSSTTSHRTLFFIFLGTLAVPALWQKLARCLDCSSRITNIMVATQEGGELMDVHFDQAMPLVIILAVCHYWR
jgi:hypothetical protein